MLNLQGKNENPCVRRFSLAHELCHLLVDWNRQQPLAVLSGYLTESALDRERRANAFAVRFLCPESVLAKVKTQSPVEAAQALARFGLPYAAVRLYLFNEAGMNAPRVAPPEFSAIGTEAEWADNEEPNGLRNFPLAIPPERRTLVALAAARAYSTGRIRRDEFAESLATTPDQPLERVLDFFALNPQNDAVSPIA